MVSFHKVKNTHLIEIVNEIVNLMEKEGYESEFSCREYVFEGEEWVVLFYNGVRTDVRYDGHGKYTIISGAMSMKTWVEDFTFPYSEIVSFILQQEISLKNEISVMLSSINTT